jgi:hypothetical protein
MISALVATSVLAADSNIGTWKMNPAKSKFSPGPAPKSQKLKIEAWGKMGSNTRRMVSARTTNLHTASFKRITTARTRHLKVIPTPT